MEVEKIATLKKMLIQEQNNLKKAGSNNADYKRSEANIAKLQEQLKQIEVSISIFKNSSKPTNLIADCECQNQKSPLLNYYVNLIKNPCILIHNTLHIF